MEKDFFEVQTPSSRIKANIVAEYFPKYCKILLKGGQAEVRYIDLFSGPGIYSDQNHSTPLLIARAVANDVVLSKKVRLAFNDMVFGDVLKSNFEALFPTGTFLLTPKFGNKVVGEDESIYNYLTREKKQTNPTPTLLFFDPFGYKNIDTAALSKFMEHWGNEIFLFVNSKRINAAIYNDKFDDLMQSLFPTSIARLRKESAYSATSSERLALIVDNLADEFRQTIKGDFYHCAFKFREEDSSGVSHFIIHFTKHPKGFELVKQIYHEFDNIGATLEKDGNYAFDAKKMDAGGMLEFGDQNVQVLSARLQKEFKGQTISAFKLFNDHHPNTLWSGQHYLKALRSMAECGVLESKFTDGIQHRKSVMLIPTCILKFS